VTEENLWAKAAVQLNEWNHGRTGMTEQTLKKQYISITERRNKIAHYSDLVDGSLKQRRPISDADVTEAIDWIERIALAIAKVLD
jgi:restriction system protein